MIPSYANHEITQQPRFFTYFNETNTQRIQNLPSLKELENADFDLSNIPVKPDARILATRAELKAPSGSNNVQLVNPNASDYCLKEHYITPISLDALEREVKAIYDRLVRVESKMNDVIQSNKGLSITLSDENLQTITALHRTLLHEFNDFFLASHYPTASTQLKAISDHYHLPQRMLVNAIQTPLTFAFIKDKTPAKDHYKVILRQAYNIYTLLTDHPDKSLANHFKSTQELLTVHVQSLQD